MKTLFIAAGILIVLMSDSPEVTGVGIGLVLMSCIFMGAKWKR